MKIFLISYDLRHPERNYSVLYDAIKDLAGNGRWQHPLESIWVVAVDENRSANSIFEILKPKIDNDDNLFVVEITDCDRQGWLAKSFWNWLNSQII